MLSTTHPHLAKEWHPTKNKKPIDAFNEGSVALAWWKCSKNPNHKPWQMSVYYRTQKKYDMCQECDVVRSRCTPENSLASHESFDPEEWDYQRNTTTPEQYSPSANKYAWWKCLGNDHSYLALLTNKLNGRKCGVCAGTQICTTDFCNSVGVVFPNLKGEWHPDNPLTAFDYTCGSNVSVWWKCKQGHEWPSIISNRTGKVKRGCPECGNKKVTSNNSLRTSHPQLAEEWHATLNDFSPDDFTAGSDKKVHWQCNIIDHHYWIAAINDRTRETNQGCSICLNRIVCPVDKCNSLQAQHPKIAKEWDYSENTETPDNVLSGSKTRVAWKCKNGHKWHSQVFHRTSTKTQCPECRVAGLV